MIKSRFITLICCAVMAAALIFTCLFASGKLGFITPSSSDAAYAEKLFDKSYIHTINIETDQNNWQSMIDNASAEEYISCNVNIDGTVLNNVGVRPKGNTSLSNVKSLDSERYSLKLEFDKYESGTNYYGLDKLCLNNIIQDNTYMKDYFSFVMMNEMGVDSPLVSYISLKVNGEEKGLYLAVEAVEEAFAKRVYGNDSGQIYKPESMAMGGGGNKGEMPKERDGEGFQRPDSFNGQGGDENSGAHVEAAQDRAASDANVNEEQQGQTGINNESQTVQSGQEQGQNQMQNENLSAQKNDGNPQIGTSDENPSPQNNQTNAQNVAQSGNQPVQDGQVPGKNEDSDGSQSVLDSQIGNSAASNQSEQTGEGQNGNNRQIGGPGGFPGGGQSSAVALQYQDDETDSYSAIFDYSVFEPDTSDKKRLISSIKKLNDGEDLDNTVNVEQVLRYFVVHNFTDNFDSYTGSMMHNYYLYEKDGQLSMIPWDYNLAFGGFSMGGGGERQSESSAQSISQSTQMVNFPIDTPVSGTTLEDRPMLGKLLENSEYMERYHELFDDFISSYFESGEFEQEYYRVFNMISDYVYRDPTKFCTYEEFLSGSDTLRRFCLLRSESIRGQLEGRIPSTSDGQSENSDALIDASDIEISAMGSMGGGGGPGGGKDGEQIPGAPPGGNDEFDPASFEGGSPDMEGAGFGGNNPERNGGGKTASDYYKEYGLLIISAAVLFVGILTAALYKRRKL